MTTEVQPKEHFNELLKRIKEIRASEKRVYLEVRNIMSLASDYNPASEESKQLFMTVQSKIHVAVTGNTGPEIILNRADASQENMGLTNWKSANIRSSDITVAKNYYNSEEITDLNNFANMYLDYAQDQFERHNDISIQAWNEKIDSFLSFHGRTVSEGFGAVSRPIADNHALEQFRIYQQNKIEE